MTHAHIRGFTHSYGCGLRMGLLPSATGIDSETRSLMISSVLRAFPGGFFYVTMPVYLYLTGLAPTVIGLLFSVQAFVGVALSIPMAMLADAFGRRRFVLLGLLLAVLAYAGFALTPSLYVLLGSMAVLGLSGATSWSPFVAMLAERAQGEGVKNSVFTLQAFSAEVISAAGMLCSALPSLLFEGFLGMRHTASFRPMFLLGAGVYATSFLLVLARTREAKQARAPRGRPLGFRLPRRSMPVIRKLSVLGLIGLGAGLVLPLLSLWFRLRFSIDLVTITPLFSVMMLATAFASLLTPRIAKAKGSVFAIVSTQISSVLLLALVPLMPDYVLAWLLMVVRNALMNMGQPIMQSFTMSMVHPDERATAQSIISTFDAVPRAWGPSIAGYLFSLGELDLPFFLTAGMYAASVGIFYMLFRRARPSYSAR